MTEWTIGAVIDAIADAVPDREMTVCGTRRSTFAQGADRTRRLANFLARHGLGAHVERDKDNFKRALEHKIEAYIRHQEGTLRAEER